MLVVLNDNTGVRRRMFVNLLGSLVLLLLVTTIILVKQGSHATVVTVPMVAPMMLINVVSQITLKWSVPKM